MPRPVHTLKPSSEPSPGPGLRGCEQSMPRPTQGNVEVAPPSISFPGYVKDFYYHDLVKIIIIHLEPNTFTLTVSPS